MEIAEKKAIRSTDATELAKLARDRDFNVRSAVATNMYTNEETRELLRRDREMAVRRLANMDTEEIKRLHNLNLRELNAIENPRSPFNIAVRTSGFAKAQIDYHGTADPDSGGFMDIARKKLTD